MSPATGQPLVQLQQHKEKNRQVAWDITLSDPKSVSAVYAVANASQRSVLDGIRAEVVQRVVLPYLQDITFSRRGKGGHTLEQADPVVAAFYHATSREMDPQTHVHLVVTNVGIRADGSTGTILSKPFYQHQGAMNALYLAELSHLLEERLGLRTEPQQSWFEVVGVPKSALDEWSKRKHEIDQAVADRGLSSAAARETAALSTRRAKKTMAREQLLTHWEAEGRRHGWTQKRLAARLGQVIVRNPYAVVQA
jgi:conjugative relaxase-like TrwC/TraI family protein